ncbi:hypothetical protein DIPPA_04806 [Diplonema papillatum]|nr:hypothetical protein DIPPA_04806 [Diplonema papillatum]|eukprot:gene16860-25852_t
MTCVRDSYSLRDCRSYCPQLEKAIAALVKVVRVGDERGEASASAVVDGCVEDISVFNSVGKVCSGIQEYIVGRLCKFVNCESRSILCAFMVLDTACARGVVLHSGNIHKLFFTSLVITVKYLEDEHWNNTTFAKIGGVSADQLFAMEIALFRLLDYNVHIPAAELDDFISDLQPSI